MNTLDQAFIKAFQQQGDSPLALAPRPSAAKGADPRREPGKPKRGSPVRKSRTTAREAKPREKPKQKQAASAARGPSSQNVSPFAIDPQSHLTPTPIELDENLLATLASPPKEAAVTPTVEAALPESDAERAQEPPLCAEPELPAAVAQPSLSPAPAWEPEFRPVWQVHQFTWPSVCRRLIARAAEELDRLADALIEANERGQKVVAMAGCRRDEGATTMLLCAARRLAERGIKAILVDADLGRPRVAKRLGVQPQRGWDEATDEAECALSQAVVEAAANNLAILPARETARVDSKLSGHAALLSQNLKTLRNHYDMALVDPGPLDCNGWIDNNTSVNLAETIDAVILVHHPGVTSEAQAMATVDRLSAAGVAVIGIVENFVAAD